MCYPGKKDTGVDRWAASKKDLFKAFRYVKDNRNMLAYCQHQDPTKAIDPIKPKK